MRWCASGALVLSDVPAAAALMGGVVLLRRGRSRAGLALLVGAAILRPINIAALGAALAWLVLIRHERRPSRAAAIAAVAAAGLFAICSPREGCAATTPSSPARAMAESRGRSSSNRRR